MEITCPRCESLHEIEPPPSARARGPRSLKFRCSHCGHTFLVDPEAPRESASPPPLGEKPLLGEAILLVQVAGQIWSVPDMAALQRWILERRLDRDTLVSKHGLRWVRAGDRDDLSVFFSASDALSFQERNLRTEMPALDDEIIVDSPEAEATYLDDIGPGPSGAMPVATGPGPSVGALRGLGAVMMEFDGLDDTQEQTVQSHGALDETPIDRVPTSFDRVESVGDRTERLARTNTVRGIPLPTGVSTITPGPAPAGSVALTPSPSPFPSQMPSLVPSRPPPYTTMPPHTPPSAAPASAANGGRGGSTGGGPSVGPPSVPSTLAPAGPVSVSTSQSFFFDNPQAPAPQPRRDVFDDPPIVEARTNWALWGGSAAVGAVAVLVVSVWMGRGEPQRVAVDPKTTAPTEMLPADVPPTAAVAPAGSPAPGATAAVVPPEVPPAPSPATPDRVVGAGSTTTTAPASVLVPPPVGSQAPRGSGAGAAKAPAPMTGATSAGASPKRLIEQGWKAVEAGDYTKAHGLFDRALQGGSAADALYGRGYANEKLGDGVSASNDYCRALGGASIDVQREIEGGLRRLGHSCS